MATTPLMFWMTRHVMQKAIVLADELLHFVLNHTNEGLVKATAEAAHRWLHEFAYSYAMRHGGLS